MLPVCNGGITALKTSNGESPFDFEKIAVFRKVERFCSSTLQVENPRTGKTRLVLKRLHSPHSSPFQK